MKPVLVGEQNPYSNSPDHDLYPQPHGATGHRLCCYILGLDDCLYLERFHRRNLLRRRDGKWSAPLARQRAREVLEAFPGAPLVLLGAKVAAAFGCSGPAFPPFTEVDSVMFPDTPSLGALFAPQSIPVRAVIVPHPSGLSRAWNVTGTYERARKMINALESR